MVAMKDFLCKVYDKLYGFLSYMDMRLIHEYESRLAKVQEDFLVI